jgi:hypothetical protein
LKNLSAHFPHVKRLFDILNCDTPPEHKWIYDEILGGSEIKNPGAGAPGFQEKTDR